MRPPEPPTLAGEGELSSVTNRAWVFCLFVCLFENRRILKNTRPKAKTAKRMLLLSLSEVRGTDLEEKLLNVS